MYIVNALTTINFFMDEITSKGTPVYLDETRQYPPYVTSRRYSSNGAERHFIGILGSTVVDADLTKECLNFHQYEVQKGSKVDIITDGCIVVQLLPRYSKKLPVGSRLYFDNGHWRKAKKKEDAFLITLSSVDERGFVTCQILKR